MKTKQLIIFGAIFIVLAAVILIFENPFEQSEYEKRVETAVPLFPKYSVDRATKIELTIAGETTTLSKQDGDWVVASMDNYPADPEAVTELLSKVGEFKNTELRSSNPEKRADFEVDSAGVEAKLMDANGEVLAHLVVGKAAPGLRSGYVRPVDSDDVYVVQGKLESIFRKNKTTRTWKDRTIFNFNKGLVTELHIISPEETVALHRDAEGNWQLQKPIAAPADAAAVDSFLTRLSQLETDLFAGPKDDLAGYGLDTPESTISAVLNDGTTAILHIGKEEEAKTYVKRGDSPTVFWIYSPSAEMLISGSGAFRAAETEIDHDHDHDHNHNHAHDDTDHDHDDHDDHDHEHDDHDHDH